MTVTGLKNEALKFLLTIAALGYLTFAVIYADSTISNFEKGIVLAPFGIVIGIRLSVLVGEGILAVLWLVRLVGRHSDKRNDDEILTGEDFRVERHRTFNLRIVPTGKLKRVTASITAGFAVMATYVLVLTWNEYVRMAWAQRCIIEGASDAACVRQTSVLAVFLVATFACVYLVWTRLGRRLLPITVNRLKRAIETPQGSIPIRTSNFSFEVQPKRSDVFESFLRFVLRGEAEILIRDSQELVVVIGQRRETVLASHDRAFLEALAPAIVGCLDHQTSDMDQSKRT